MRRSILLATAPLLGLLAACPPPPQAAADGGTDAGMAADASVDGGADGGVCWPLVGGAVIRDDVTFCPGTVSAAVAPGQAAVTIAADDVEAVCDRTVIVGTAGFGTVQSPTVGIKIGPYRNVTVIGCTARAFRYGLLAQGAHSLTVREATLDDNFTDPDAGWVQDTVQGGGIRLDGVDGGLVTASSFRRNWNGIELRGARNVTVSRNQADHCSNTAATLDDSHDNELSDNDFSWGIRGDGLSYPSRWYGVDTRDSAGIIVDARSSKNRILRNDLRYGGDGVFIRSIIGACAEDNRVEGNDTSFSPHNAIECWCDGNAFIDNVASDSDYGIWLGGTDRAVVRKNRVERNRTDGISIQIGEDRHTVIEDNTIADNGRVGILLTGREYQSWHPLSSWAPNLANSSHLVVQNNTFSIHGQGDIFITSTRSVLVASNCGPGGGAPQLVAFREAELVKTVGTCGVAAGRTSPTAALLSPASAPAGASVFFDASGSRPAVAGDALGFTWLVQPAGLRFASGSLPPAIVARDGAATESVAFPSPGLFDVDVTVNDGRRAAMAWRSIAVLPQGQRVGEAASSWATACAAAPGCVTRVADETGGLDGTAVRITTDAPFDFAATTPPSRDLGLAPGAFAKLGFFVRARNDNEYGWQGNFPVVVVGGPGGTVRHEPAANLLPTQPQEWIFVEVPLAGGPGWTRTVAGSPPSKIDWLEFHTDTWGYGAVNLWLDAVTLY